MSHRRIVSIIIVSALLAALFLTPAIIQAGGSALHISDLSAPQSALDGIMSARSSASFSASITLNGTVLMTDKPAGRYYYSLTGGDYNPQVHISSNEGLNIVFLKSAITPQTVRDNIALPFVLYDDSGYQQGELVVTTLPLMSIRTGSAIGQQDTPGLMQLYDNNTGSLLQSSANIRIRGGLSQMYPKKSLRLSLRTQSDTPRHLPLLGLRNDDDWILYAAYNEPEKLRCALATGLWEDIGAQHNSFGIDFGAQCRFVELFVNGAYNGLYLLMTPVDAKQTRLRQDTNPAQCEYLYRSVSYVTTTSADFKSAANAAAAGRFELREPDDAGNTYVKWQPLDILNSLVTQGSDDEFADEIFKLTEKNNVVDYWVFTNMVYAEDNVEKNVNLAAKYRDGQYTVLLGAWDLDLTFGNYYTEEEALSCRVDARLADAGLWNSTLMERALTLDTGGVRAAINQRWTTLRSGVLSQDAVLARLSLLEQDVYGSGAAQRDHARWPDAAFTPDTTALSQFIRERLAFMDSFVDDISLGRLP